MHWSANIVSKSVYHGSNVLFLGVLSNQFVTRTNLWHDVVIQFEFQPSGFGTADGDIKVTVSSHIIL